jgi:hypothetical protein
MALVVSIRGDGSRILQSCASYLCEMDYTRLPQIFILFRGGGEAEVLGFWFVLIFSTTTAPSAPQLSTVFFVVDLN